MGFSSTRHFFFRIMVFPVFLIGCHMGRCADGRATERVWGDVAGGSRMSVSIEQKDFAVCYPIVLQVVLRNVSERPLSFVVSGDQDFSFTVLDERGEEVPLTRYGTMTQNPDRFYMRLVKSIAPGDEAKWVFTINRSHDMTVAGAYLVKVRRRVLGQDRENSVEVVSNSLKVVVREDAPTPDRGDE